MKLGSGGESQDERGGDKESGAKGSQSMESFQVTVRLLLQVKCAITGGFPGRGATRPDLYFQRFMLAVVLSGNTTLFALGEDSLTSKFHFGQWCAAKC